MCTYEQLAALASMPDHRVDTMSIVVDYRDLHVSVCLVREDAMLWARGATPQDAFEDAYSSLASELGWRTPYDEGLDGRPMSVLWSDAGKEEWRRGDHDRATRDREAS